MKIILHKQVPVCGKSRSQISWLEFMELCRRVEELTPLNEKGAGDCLEMDFNPHNTLYNEMSNRNIKIVIRHTDNIFMVWRKP